MFNSIRLLLIAWFVYPIILIQNVFAYVGFKKPVWFLAKVSLSIMYFGLSRIEKHDAIRADMRRVEKHIAKLEKES